MGSVLAVVALALFSANVFVVRSASVRLDQQVGFLVALVANVVFAAGLFGADLARRAGGFDWDTRAFLTFALAGVFASYLGRRGFFRSVETLGPSRASAVQITNPVFAAVLAWLLIGESLGLPEVLMIAIVISGLYLTNLPAREDERTTQLSRGRRTVPVAALWPALFSAMAYAGGNVLRAHAMDAWREPVFGGLVGAAAGTLTYVLLHVRKNPLRWLDHLPVAGLMLWALAGGLTISAQIAVIAATGYLPVAIVLAVSSALPLVVVPVSLLVLRNVEGLRLATVVGTGLVLVGVTGILLR